jgi:hypothetical protein
MLICSFALVSFFFCFLGVVEGFRQGSPIHFVYAFGFLVTFGLFATLVPLSLNFFAELSEVE